MVSPRWQQESREIYEHYTIYHQSGGAEQNVFDLLGGAGKPRSDRIIQAIRQACALPAQGRLLDIGCGNGSFLSAWSRLISGWSLCGTEVSEKYKAGTTILQPNELLVIYTDGVTEARDAAAHLFSEERTAQILKTGGAMSAAAMVDRLVAAVDAFTGEAEQADDITILAVQFRPPPHLDGRDGDRLPRDTVVIHNRVTDLAEIEVMLDRLGERGRLSSDTMSEIRIVCDEVLANIIEHGFPDGAEHDITVSV